MKTFVQLVVAVLLTLAALYASVAYHPQHPMLRNIGIAEQPPMQDDGLSNDAY